MLATLLMLAAMGCWLASALAGLFEKKDFLSQVFGVGGAALALGGALAVLGGGGEATFTFPFWGGQARLSVDPLSAAFLLPLHVIAGLGVVYGKHYCPLGSPRATGRWMRFFFGILAASMTLVFSARQGILFLMGWEAMAISAMFLIGTDHEHPEVRRATWIYLVCTHAGTLVLTAMVVLLAQRLGGWAWWPLRGAGASSLDLPILVLAIVGFGFKAGIAPLHFWLPAAHASAPSHVSAILSAVMLKAGIYGVLRVQSLLLPVPHMGGVLMAIGAGTALFGVGCALAQRDYKRLLAYSSIENIGIIFMGVGLGLCGRAMGNPWLAALGFGGAVFHVWSHAAFKSLLFLGSGAILNATHTRDLEALGGLAQGMPRTAMLVLPGVLAVCALPPFNGFLSEWILYRGLFAFILGGGAWAAGLALFALALTGGLAALAFAKFFGFLFLGLPRSGAAREARDPGLGMEVPMLVLGCLCLVQSLGGWLLLPALDSILAVLCPGQEPLLAIGLGPGMARFTGVAILLLGLGGLAWIWVKRLPSAAVRPGTWDCGYAQPTARMQYTAQSFSDTWAALVPGRKARMRRIREVFARPSSFASDFKDVVGEGFVGPRLDRVATRLQRFRRLQQGHLSMYLLYILITLVGIFIWAALRPRLLA